MQSQLRGIVAASVIVCSQVWASGVARAETERSGITAGLSLGGGVISPSCERCDTLGGPAVELHIGWAVTPQLAVMYDGSGVAHTGDGFGSEMSLLFAGAAQYRVVPRLWLKGGLGLARMELREGVFGQNESSISGFGILAAAGYELYQSGNFVFDAHMRVTSAFYDDNRVINTSLQVGVNWY